MGNLGDGDFIASMQRMMMVLWMMLGVAFNSSSSSSGGDIPPDKYLCRYQYTDRLVWSMDRVPTYLCAHSAGDVHKRG